MSSKEEYNKVGLGGEKYISIDYNKWESYYKPLEVLNKELKSEIFELRNKLSIEIDKKEISIRLKLSTLSYHDYGNKGNITVGVYSLDTRTILDINTDYFVQELKKEMYKHSMTDPGRWVNNLLTEDKLYKFYDDLQNSRQELQNKRMEIATQINKLPRIIRWIFKIKNNVN